MKPHYLAAVNCHRRTAVVLAAVLLGCSSTKPTVQHDIAVRVRDSIFDSPQTVAWWTHVAHSLDKPKRLQPDDLRATIESPSAFTHGQFAARDAQAATATFDQLFAEHYRRRYQPNDDKANRAALQTLRAGVLEGVRR